MKNILFISDKSYWSYCAALLTSSYSDNCEHVIYERGSKFPGIVENWTGDFLISFKSDLIIPSSILERTKLNAINFHPAPPKYRGIGGYIQAIDNKDTTYGITCHHMESQVDSGDIIKTILFPICKNDTPKTLYHKSGFYCIRLLNEILISINTGEYLPKSSETWSKTLYLFKDHKSRLNEIVD